MHKFQQECGYCGNKFHKRTAFPAKRSNCGNYGQFAKQFRSRAKPIDFFGYSDVTVMNGVSGAPDQINVNVFADGVGANALTDTQSTLSHTNKSFALTHKFNLGGERNEFSLAVTLNCF